MPFVIEKGIPIPDRPSSPWIGYPWDEMRIGDSFLVPKTSAKSARNAAFSRGRAYKEKYVTRTVEDGLRVWRVE